MPAMLELSLPQRCGPPGVLAGRESLVAAEASDVGVAISRAKRTPCLRPSRWLDPKHLGLR